MLAILMLLTEVITSTITGSYRYGLMGYDQLTGQTLKTDRRVVVAVLDSGISQEALTYFGDKVTLKQDTSQNKVDKQSISKNSTHAERVIAAMVNDTGTSGTCFISSCHVYLYKVIKQNHFSTPYSVGIGVFLACSTPEVDIVNLSLSTYIKNNLTELAIMYCVFQDKLVVTAAGNDGFTNWANYPCSSSFTLCVSSVDRNSNVFHNANRSAKVDVYAPGVYMRVNVDSGPVLVTGTSYATGLVSGLAALVLSQHGNLSAEELRNIVVSSSHDNNRIVNINNAIKLGETND